MTWKLERRTRPLALNWPWNTEHGRIAFFSIQIAFLNTRWRIASNPEIFNESKILQFFTKYFSLQNRFYLQLKPGGLIRVHTSALQPTSQYKSLVISEETTSDELLSLLLSSYNSNEPVEQFSLYEVSKILLHASFVTIFNHFYENYAS